METSGDSTVFLAAIVATVIALALAASARAGVIQEARRGATPLWAYALILIAALALPVLVVEGDRSPFLFNLASILVGMLVGCGVAYYLFRAVLSVWTRLSSGPRDT